MWVETPDHPLTVKPKDQIVFKSVTADKPAMTKLVLGNTTGRHVSYKVEMIGKGKAAYEVKHPLGTLTAQHQVEVEVIGKGKAAYEVKHPLSTLTAQHQVEVEVIGKGKAAYEVKHPRGTLTAQHQVEVEVIGKGKAAYEVKHPLGTLTAQHQVEVRIERTRAGQASHHDRVLLEHIVIPDDYNNALKCWQRGTLRKIEPWHHLIKIVNADLPKDGGKQIETVPQKRAIDQPAAAESPGHRGTPQLPRRSRSRSKERRPDGNQDYEADDDEGQQQQEAKKPTRKRSKSGSRGSRGTTPTSKASSVETGVNVEGRCAKKEEAPAEDDAVSKENVKQTERPTEKPKSTPDKSPEGGDEQDVVAEEDEVPVGEE